MMMVNRFTGPIKKYLEARFDYQVLRYRSYLPKFRRYKPLSLEHGYKLVLSLHWNGSFFAYLITIHSGLKLF